MKRKDVTPAAESPVFAKGEAARPRVQQPDSPMTVWIGMGGALVLGFMVFNGLSAGREAKAQTPEPAPAARQPAPAPAPPPAPAPVPPPVAQPAPFVQQSVSPPDPEQAHWRAPTMVVDLTQSEGGAMQLAQAAGGAAAPGPQPMPGQGIDPRQSADERFSARVTGGLGDVARAGQMRDLGRVVPEGTVIAAVLETAINSDLPGSVRGVVSRDVRSFDGSRVLIPRGSKLVGQYKSAAAPGQSRAFVVWERIISPTGVTIQIGSPGTDRLGRGGLDGEVDRHFFQKFGAAILLTVLQAGTTALASEGGGSTVIIGSAGGQVNQVGQSALQAQANIADTIKVAQGVPVQVFVARDLDFGAVVR